MLAWFALGYCEAFDLVSYVAQCRKPQPSLQWVVHWLCVFGAPRYALPGTHLPSYNYMVSTLQWRTPTAPPFVVIDIYIEIICDTRTISRRYRDDAIVDDFNVATIASQLRIARIRCVIMLGWRVLRSQWSHVLLVPVLSKEQCSMGIVFGCLHAHPYWIPPATQMIS